MKHIDVTRTTHTNLDVEQEKHIDDCWNIDGSRGIYFIDPEDEEFKETIKNARKKLETSVAPAMPCGIVKNCGSGGSDKSKNKTCVCSGS